MSEKRVQTQIEIVNEHMDEMLYNIANATNTEWQQVYKFQALSMLHLSIKLGIIPEEERNTYLGRIVNAVS